MRPKLQKFTAFAEQLLPHEVDYLLQIEQFKDADRLAILERVAHNAKAIDAPLPYDESINKRKYSNLKNWIVDKLREVDVDERFKWMNDLEERIATDSIAPDEERLLLREIKRYDEPNFYFAKFYELVRAYRHFLLIRMRYADHKIVNDFLLQHHAAYARTQRINEQLHVATLDIVTQYETADQESIKWANWLREVFYDTTLDGLNRYLAFVRLTFMYFNYRTPEKLLEIFDYQSSLFRVGKYYSRRLLLNYYGNRLLLHARLQAWEKAEQYGYWSIRGRNADHLHYVNNLSTILLLQKKYTAALQLMRDSFGEMKATQNYHEKIGFVASYVKLLNQTKEYSGAEHYCETFLKAYQAQILQYRWHSFFSIYLETLAYREKYDKLQRVIAKYQLREKDAHYEAHPIYLPNIKWLHQLADFKLGHISRKAMVSAIVEDVKASPAQKTRRLKRLLHEMKPFLGDVLAEIRSALHREGYMV